MSGIQYSISQNQPTDSQQAQPWAVIKFFSFFHKDTLYNQDGTATLQNATQVRELVITSDIMRIQTSSNKNSFQMTAEAVLSSGDLNYQAVLSPGDHAMIWLGNDRRDIERLVPLIKNNSPANDFLSGLKFIGRVNSVRSILNTSPSGIKTLRYVVTFKGFSEFGTNVYYNKFLAPAETEFILSQISKDWQTYFFSQDRTKANVQKLIQFLIDAFLGQGPGPDARYLEKAVRSPNYAFLIPRQMLNILGITNQSHTPNYANMLNYIMGVQRYNNSNSFLPDINTGTTNSVHKFTTQLLHGTVTALPDNFNNVQLWDLIQQVCNPSINEIYTTLRVDNNNSIMPHFIARLIPFTSIYSSVNGGGSKFIDLPRWIIDNSMAIHSFNFGTSDAARFNFFQVYGNLYGLGADPQSVQQMQIAGKNFTIDDVDISRNGSRNMITTTLVDFSDSQDLSLNINTWAKLITDWYGNGHLKLNGSVNCAGIREPICVGDNLQIAGNLFHIEGVSHIYECQEDTGLKSFVTSMDLSQGVLSNGQYAFFAPRKRADMNPDNKGLEPGFSDEEVAIVTVVTPDSVDLLKQITRTS